MKVLDTSVLIDLDKEPEAFPIGIGKLKAEDALLVSSVAVFEFYWGICLQYKGSNNVPKSVERKFYEFFSAFKLIAVNFEVARDASSIGVKLRAKGKMIDLHDLYIAATARFSEVAVVTRNVDHFNRIDGLDVISWPMEKA
jgi:tRNA(fMet)-specific endonuclease VapC